MSDLMGRLREIREYRHLSQEQVAEWFGITKQAWGKKERGESDGFSPKDFETILKKTDIDARWLFGQVPEGTPIQEADLRNKKNEYSYSDLVAEVREIKQTYQPAEKDPLLSKVRISAPLRETIEQIQHLDASKLGEIKALIFAYLYQQNSSAREKKGA